MKTESYSVFNFFISSYLGDAKLIDQSENIVVINKNMYSVLIFENRVELKSAGFIPKTVKEPYLIQLKLSEYKISSNQETSICIEMIIGNKSIYYVGTQRKDIFEGFKFIKQLSGWNYLLKEMILDCVKKLR